MRRSETWFPRYRPLMAVERGLWTVVSWLKKRRFSLADVPFTFSHACNRFLHWSTALSMMFCDTLVHVLVTRCFKLLVSQTGVLFTRISALIPRFSTQLGLGIKVLYHFISYKHLIRTFPPCRHYFFTNRLTSASCHFHCCYLKANKVW